MTNTDQPVTLDYSGPRGIDRDSLLLSKSSPVSDLCDYIADPDNLGYRAEYGIEAAIEYAHIMKQHAEQLLADLIDHARQRHAWNATCTCADRLSWQQIADVLGVSKQAVQQKYGQPDASGCPNGFGCGAAHAAHQDCP